MTKLFFAECVFFQLILICQAAIYSSPGPDGETGNGKPTLNGKPVILLGGLFPVHSNKDSSCGEILDLGVQRLEAMVLATQLINQSPQLLPEVELGFEIRDTCVYANLALEESLSYVRNRGISNATLVGISGVVGAASSGISIVVANLLRLFQVPQISYASTAKILSDKTRFDYFFRTVPPDSLQARAMADIILHFNWTYIHAVYSDDAYGSEGIDAFFQEITNQNVSKICIATIIKIPHGVTRESVFDDAVDQLNQAWTSNSSVVVLFGQLSTALGVLTAVKKVDALDPGFSERFTWIGSDAWGDQLPSEFHSVASGMLSVSPKASKSSDFDRYFMSLNPVNYTENPWFNEYWGFLFNCSFNENDSQLQLCDPTNQVISPKIGYRQNSKVTFTIDAVYAFAHAIHNLLTSTCPSNQLCDNIVDTRSGGVAIRGDLLLEYLRNVSFMGVSASTIEFDSSGDEQGDFVIKNLKRSGKKNELFYDFTGTWSPLTLLDLTGVVEWSDGGNQVPPSVCSLPCDGGEYPEPIPGQSECCWLCRPCLGDRLVSDGRACSVCGVGFIPNRGRTECIVIAPDYLKWYGTWSIVLIIVCFFGLLTTGVVILMLVIFYKHPMVKALSRELSAVMLTGLFLCYIIPFLFIAKPSIPICSLRRFCVGVAFSICYSGLLVKTNRIHRIFNRAESSLQKPLLISPQSQLFFVLLLVSVEVVIAVVWLTVERPSVKVIYSNFAAELTCGESPIIGFFIYIGYNLILLVLSTFYGIRSRKIPQCFNETKMINFTLFSTIILWIGLVPTYFVTAKVGAVYQTISLVIALILSATVMLCILFLSKIYFLISQRRKEIRDTQRDQTGNRLRHNSICSTNLLAGNNVNLSPVNGMSHDFLSVQGLSPNRNRSLSAIPSSFSCGLQIGSPINRSTARLPGLSIPRIEIDGRSISSCVSFPPTPTRVAHCDASTQTFANEEEEEEEEEVCTTVSVSLLPSTAISVEIEDVNPCDNQATSAKDMTTVVSVCDIQTATAEEGLVNSLSTTDEDDTTDGQTTTADDAIVVSAACNSLATISEEAATDGQITTDDAIVVRAACNSLATIFEEAVVSATDGKTTAGDAIVVSACNNLATISEEAVMSVTDSQITASDDAIVVSASNSLATISEEAVVSAYSTQV